MTGLDEEGGPRASLVRDILTDERDSVFAENVGAGGVLEGRVSGPSISMGDSVADEVRCVLCVWTSRPSVPTPVILPSMRV